MLGIDVKKQDNKLVISWQLSKFEISISEIIDVFSDNTYAGEDKNAIRIGTPYATTDRIAIKTKSKTYILYTTNGVSLKSKIKSYMK
ncbi:hypothetical protein D3C75_1165440 [compost metagenome]